MKRVLIIGSGGSGKSTLAKKIHQITAIPVIHLDEHYWNPNWVETPPEEWSQRVAKLLESDAWIMDGNYGGTLNQRLEKADCVIFLQMPRLLCIYRVLLRNWRYKGQDRPTMGKNCPDRVTWEFIRYLWNYPNNSGINALKKVNAYQGSIPIYIFQNKRSIQHFLDKLGKSSNS